MINFIDVIGMIFFAFLVSLINALTRGDKENIFLKTVIGTIIITIIMIIFSFFY